MKTVLIQACIVVLVVGCECGSRDGTADATSSRGSQGNEDQGHRATADSSPEPDDSAAAPLDAAGAEASQGSAKLESLTEAKVRVLATPGSERWRPCGVIHSVGAIVVEVLDVGGAPRMVLLVSCPVGFPHGKLLQVGRTFRVTFHGRRQPWPTPPAARELPDKPPRRYVDEMEPAGSATADAGSNERHGYEVSVRFEDVRGLTVGSRVVVAGVPVGQVASIRRGGEQDRVDIRMTQDVALYEGIEQDDGHYEDGATVTMKRGNLLGEHYLEIAPGSAGAELGEGDRIKNVVDETDNGRQ